MPAKKTPVDRVVSAFGSVRAVAGALKIDVRSIYRWRKPEEQGGCGGRIPSKLQRPLLEAARAQGVKLTPADVVESPEARS